MPDTSDIKVCTVDSYNSIGTELTIDVAKEGDYYIPHIAYYGKTPKKPRYAYIADPVKFFDDEDMDGANRDYYTGIWECEVVPIKSTVTEDEYRRFNVGIWKKNGERAYSTYTNSENTISFDGTDRGINKTYVARTDGNYKSSAGADSGICYGNGTNYAVLGYGIKNSNDRSRDFVETAQKR